MKKAISTTLSILLVLLTNAQINVFPWHEDFSTHNSGAGTVVNGWSCNSALSSTFSWRVWNTGIGTSANTGPTDDNGGDHKYIYTEASKGSTGTAAYITSPVFDVTNLTSPEITFYYHMYGSNMGTLNVEVIKNGVVTTEASIVGEQHNSANASWSKAIVDLSAFTGNIQIRFKGIRGNGFRSDMSIDDFDIHEEIACPGTSSEYTNEVSDVSAKLNWTETGSANNWSIEYGPDGFVQGTGTTVNNIISEHKTINGLSAESDYQWYVRSNCGVDGNSVWNGPFSFTTFPNIVALPYNENFDNLANIGYHILPSGMDANGDIYSWLGTANEPAASGGIHLLAAGTSTQHIYTPPVTIVAGTSYDISFNYRQENNGTDEWDLSIVRGTTKSGINMTSVGATALDLVNTNYQHFKRTFVAASNMTTFFGIRIYCPTFGFLYIDDIKIEETPSCSQPTILSADNITLNSALASWTETAVANTWNIEWKAGNDFAPGTGASTGSSVVNLNPSYQLTNLTANTNYYFYVRSSCGGGDYSNWSGPYNFSTLDGKAVNPSPVDSAVPVALNARTLNWDDVQGADSYTISIGTTPGGTNIANSVACANSQYIKPSDWTYGQRYYWTVTTVYNGGALSVGDVWNFFTECDAVSVFPFTNDFENGIDIDCWFQTDVNGVNGEWTAKLVSPNQTGAYEVTPHGGLNMATFNSYQAIQGQSTRIETPSLDFNGIANPELSFFMYHDEVYQNNIDRIQIQAYTGGAWVNIGNPIYRYASTNSSYNKSWVKETIDLTAYSGNIIKIGILAISDNGMDIYIDDLLVQDAPTCSSPTVQNTTNIYLNEAKLLWTSSPGTNLWEVEYGIEGYAQGSGTTVSNINNTYLQLNGLSGSTSYDWYVRTDCGNGDYSEWLGPNTFKTDYFSSNAISGTTNKCSPTYQRLNEDGTAAVGEYFYDKFSFTVPKNGDYRLYGIFSGYTGFVSLYTNAFDPENPASNWLAGAEEGSNNSAYTEYIHLETGITYIAVGTSLNPNTASNFGSCQYLIQGDGEVVLAATTDINGVAIGTSNNVPATDGTARTANYQCVDNNSWTHYYDDNGTATNYSDDNIILSVKKNGNNIGNIGDNGFSVSLSGSAGVSLIQKAQAPYVFDDGGWYVYNRFWNLAPTSQPNSPVNVKYYYTDADYSALQTAISDMGGSVPANHEATAYFKINSITGNYDPNPENGHIGIPLANAYNTDGCWIYVNNNVASTVSWKYGNYKGGHYSELQVGHFSGGGGGASTVNDLGGSPLPIKLGEFNAYPNNDVNTILWTTLTEENTDVFIIEKSISNISNFKELKRVGAANNSNIPLDYTIEDENPAQLTYYRITTVDLDGRQSQSRIIVVDRKVEENVMSISKISPNPTTDIATIVFSSPNSAKTIAQITDMLGNIIITKEIDAQEGLNFTKIDLKKYQNGIYILTLRNQYSTTTSKIIKQ